MAIFEKVGGSGGGGSKYSTLPPPVTNLKAKSADMAAEVSFDGVAAEYEEYLGKAAYIVVLKEGGVPEHPKDGKVIKLDKSGAVV